MPTKRYILYIVAAAAFCAGGLAPHVALAITCDSGAASNISFTDTGFGTCRGFITTGTYTFTKPSDWSDTNTVECVGSGGNGSDDGPTNGGGGGGGGAYAINSDIASLPTTVDVRVGNGGTTTNTVFNSGDAGPKKVSCDYGRSVSGSSSGGAGGTVGNSTGDSAIAGGGGGTSASGDGGGGGGAAGAVGAGGDGAASITGGSANGGTTAGPTAQGSVGNSGTEWGATTGVGTGGAGGSGGGNKNGGNGGAYGGGGGGSNSGNGTLQSTGGDGLIIVIYTPAAAGAPAEPTRRMRLFNGMKIQIIGGKLHIQRQ